jgi:hypothetical protein
VTGLVAAVGVVVVLAAAGVGVGVLTVGVAGAAVVVGAGAEPWWDTGEERGARWPADAGRECRAAPAEPDDGLACPTEATMTVVREARALELPEALVVVARPAAASRARRAWAFAARA